MFDRLIKYWPILLALVSGIALLIQTGYSVGEVHEKTTTAASELTERIERHESRPGHEQTAIRLERIEVQQTGIARDVGRIQGQLDELGDDVREAMRR
jgi:hypothetical protein